jgi:hypothetical protein
MELRKSKRRDSLERLCLNKSKKTNKVFNLGIYSERKYLFKYYPQTGRFIKTIS